MKMADASRSPLDAEKTALPALAYARLRAWISDRSASGVAQRFASLAYLFRLANAGIAFLTQILLARWMGQHEFGIYVYVWTWVVLLGTLTNVGLASSPQRFIPTYVERGEHDLLRGFIHGGRWLAFALATTFSVIAGGLILLLGEYVSSWLLVPAFLGLACLPLFVVQEVQEASPAPMTGRISPWRRATWCGRSF